MINLIKKTDKVFEETKNFIAKNSYIIIPILMVGFFMLVQNETIFASSAEAFAKESTTKTFEKLIMIIFIGGGIVLFMFGAFEVAVTVFGQNPDAKNKAVLGILTGVVLIALGISFLLQIEPLVTFLFS